MRTIKIANDKKRDAQVGFELNKEKSDISMVHPEGLEYQNIKILKSTIKNDADFLLNTFGSPLDVGNAIINGDPDIDFEKAGMLLKNTKKVYLNSEGKIAYRISRSEIVYNVDGTTKEEREYKRNPSNIYDALSAINWSGRTFPIDNIIRSFVFSKTYQIKHVNGLTFDFLYDMAKQLADSCSMMLIGSGPKGIGPLVFSEGGTPYRAFLEGRIDGDKYCLLLHLSNMEMKNIC